MSLFDLSEPKIFNVKDIIADIKEIIESTVSVFNEYEGGVNRGKKKKFHDTLQRELVELAVKYGLLGDKEFLIKGYDEGRNGYIDVVWRGADGNKLLLEIDFSPRVKSVKKLLVGTSEIKIWLYYGKKSANRALLLDKEGQIYYVHVPLGYG